MTSTDRSIGKIKMVNQDKGFGFIRRENGSDLFFHVSECCDRMSFKNMKEGMTIRFSVGPGKRGDEGRDVEIVPDEVPATDEFTE